jgi:hypothetical protein
MATQKSHCVNTVSGFRLPCPRRNHIASTPFPALAMPNRREAVQPSIPPSARRPIGALVNKNRKLSSGPLQPSYPISGQSDSGVGALVNKKRKLSSGPLQPSTGPLSGEAETKATGGNLGLKEFEVH